MRTTRTAIVASSLASLFPLILCWTQFRQLFFFHDDWELLDGATRLTLINWLAQPFLAEGVFPLFKLLWLGAVHLTGGSYFGMILLLWITHVAICLLFGWLLARFGLPPVAIAFSVLTFGLAWTNLETLGWSMQWNSQLALVFFFAAWHFLLDAPKSGAAAAACFVCLVASALCWRGIVSGLLLAIFVLLQNKPEARARLFLLCLTPTALMIATMWLLVPHHEVSLTPAILYARDYLLLNPLYRLLPLPRNGYETLRLLICGTLKAAIFVWAIRKAAPSTRPLLWTLVAFDLIVAASLGYSRWTTPLATATSSRYQYIPLLCFGAMAGIAIARLRPAAQAAIFAIWICVLIIPWKRHAEQWSTARGIELRNAIAQDAPAEHFDPSSLTAARARELVQLYGLH